MYIYYHINEKETPEIVFRESGIKPRRWVRAIHSNQEEADGLPGSIRLYFNTESGDLQCQYDQNKEFVEKLLQEIQETSVVGQKD